MGREGALRAGQSLGGTRSVEKKARVVASITLCHRMVWAERHAADSDDPVKQPLGLVHFPAIAQQPAQVAEARRRVGMLGTERLFTNCDCPLQ